jgi:serine/threonine protein kinase
MSPTASSFPSGRGTGCSVDMTLRSGTRLGAYEIISAIGAGGMGEVYRGRDTRLNRDVALKVLPDAFTLDPERLARFKREAQVLAAIARERDGASRDRGVVSSPRGVSDARRTPGGSRASRATSRTSVLDLLEFAVAVNRSDPAALALASNGVTSDIPFDGTEVRRLINTM